MYFRVIYDYDDILALLYNPMNLRYAPISAADTEVGGSAIANDLGVSSICTSDM